MPPEKENAAPMARTKGCGAMEFRRWDQEDRPLASKSLGVCHLMLRFGISVELATVVAELAGIGGEA